MSALGNFAFSRSCWRVGLSALIASWCSVVVVSCMRTPPILGLHGNRLSPCPLSPNCVCSFEAEPRAAIDPLICPGPTTATQELMRLRDLLRRVPRTRLLEERPRYLRFEVTSGLFRFRDDLEFLADDASKVIHVRSASRLGYSDLGTNRRRVEAIRHLFANGAVPNTPQR